MLLEIRFRSRDTAVKQLQTGDRCMQAPSKDYCLREKKPPSSPQPAAAVVEAWLGDATVSLPFDQDPGTAERFTELWAKAFKEVCVAFPAAACTSPRLS